MGKYRDLAHSHKPAGGSAANENFARELLPLLMIGRYKPNPDGSNQADALGHPGVAYNPFTVQQVALALTGWIFPGPNNNNWEKFSGPQPARQINPDTHAKKRVATTVPAGQTFEADLAASLDGLFAHPNIAPFISTHRIRARVKRNPTSAYIARIAAVFGNNGVGARGDLKAGVRAILLEAEARDEVGAANAGRLKGALLNAVALVCALGGSLSPTNQRVWPFTRMSRTLLTPNSVFGFYSPLYPVSRSPEIEPEFQIYGPTEPVLRGNFHGQVLANPGVDMLLDLSTFVALAGNTIALIAAADQTLLFGRLPVPMRPSRADAINAQSDAVSKARTALDLTACSDFDAVPSGTGRPRSLSF